MWHLRKIISSQEWIRQTCLNSWKVSQMWFLWWNIFLQTQSCSTHQKSTYSSSKSHEFSIKSSLKKHVKSVHEDRKVLKCESCDKIFICKRSKEKHIQKFHSNIRSQMPSSNEQPISTKDEAEDKHFELNPTDFLWKCYPKL